MFIFANVNIYLILKNNMKRLVITIIFAFALFVDLFGRQMNNYKNTENVKVVLYENDVQEIVLVYFAEHLRVQGKCDE